MFLTARAPALAEFSLHALCVCNWNLIKSLLHNCSGCLGIRVSCAPKISFSRQHNLILGGFAEHRGWNAAPWGEASCVQLLGDVLQLLLTSCTCLDLHHCYSCSCSCYTTTATAAAAILLQLQLLLYYYTYSCCCFATIVVTATPVSATSHEISFLAEQGLDKM